MRRKRTPAVRAGEIAKAAALQGLLPFFRIWFTVPFRETITIGRKRVAICRRHRPPAGRSRGRQTRRWRVSSGRAALLDRQRTKAPARRRG